MERIANSITEQCGAQLAKRTHDPDADYYDCTYCILVKDHTGLHKDCDHRRFFKASSFDEEKS